MNVPRVTVKRKDHMKRTLTILLVSAVALALMVGTGVTGSKSQRTAWLGVYTQTVDDDLVEAFGLSQDHGAMINRVVKDSPADKAGIQEDDVIITFDGKTVYDSADLTELVRDREPGAEITVVVVRDGKEQELTVTLGRSKRATTWSMTPYYKGLGLLGALEDRPYVGVSLSSLSEQLGDYFGVAEGEGALITEVEDASPAEDAGLKAGDIIVAIGSEKVFDPDDVIEIVGELDEGATAEFTVVRERKEQKVTVEVAEREHDEEDLFGRVLNLRAPDMGTYDIYVPEAGNFWKQYDSRVDRYLDARDDYEDELGELRQEVRELKKQLKELQEKLR